MDNTSNGQNQNQPTIGQQSPSSQPVSTASGAQSIPPQTSFSQPQSGGLPIPSQQPYQQIPQVQQPVQPYVPQPLQPSDQNLPTQPRIQSAPTSSTTQPTGTSSRITLEDLYGPSGFGKDTSEEKSFAPVSNTQPAPSFQPSAQPVPVPEPQNAPLEHSAQLTQQPSVVSSQPVVTHPTELPVNTSQQPVQEVQPRQTVQIAPPQMTTSEIQQIPQLSTVGQQEELKEEKPTIAEVPQEISGHEMLQDLPLRKQRIKIDAEPIPSVDNPTSPPPPQKSSTDGKPKSGGVNKLFLLRILFGIIGAGIALIVILFLVTWISGLSHPSASGKVTLTYWGLWEDSNTMQTAISDFERQHPDITVNYIKEDPKQYSQRLLTRIQQGNGPDIFTYHSSWLPMVKSALIPLPTSVISKQELQNNFYPVVTTDLVKNGALYGIPLEVDTLSLFVNNTLFQNAKAQVPTSWDTFTSTARALTQKDSDGKIKIAGAALGTYDNITHAPDILSMLFSQNGVDTSTVSPKTNASDALSFYSSFATGDSKVWDSTLDPSQLAFAKGNLAMYFGYSWDVFALKATNPSLDFSVYPVPHLPGRNTTTASYWVEGVSGKSQHQKEALLLMQFLAQKNTEAEFYAEEAKTRLFGEPYARSDLGSTLKSNALVYPFVSQATDATSSFFAGETDDSGLNGQMNGYLGNAVRSLLNNTSADTAVDTLSQGVQQVENQYGSQ